MSKLFIKNPLHPDGVRRDILIEGNKIVAIGNLQGMEAGAEVIDASRMAVIPGLINCHTHAAMTFFRGYGDDLRLMDWLNNMIWPVEAHMTEEDVYVGTKLACLEMIKSGTTAFLDMYSFPHGTARAVEEMGLRANVSYTVFDRGDKERAELDKRNMERYLKEFERYSDRVQLSIGPHAIYTVTGPMLQYTHDFAKANDLLVHLHLSETEGEVKECVKEHGTTPVRYLQQLGVLSPNLVLAHSLWMDSEELQILADHGVACVHNPASNMKLASGYRFKIEEMWQKGIRVGIGTDGTSSSNNLDMFTAMKLTSFLAKAWSGDPTSAKAEEVFKAATFAGAEILRIPAGRIEVGRLADLALLQLDIPEMTPCHNLVSNVVYSANGSAVDTLIVDGRVLMRGRHVPGEEAIMSEARTVARDLFERSKKQKR
ncbi:amidohydrolase [Porphyromonas somerae]|uniref:amidohydrolase n=1 Tax=Porphyromonas somerae TaxID=322095 RepID=UPI002A761BCC|nr:amidohydrolase [Porphyromonas somerae]MDY3119854.1 amidohydrolase [Porphyromonas somerae]